VTDRKKALIAYLMERATFTLDVEADDIPVRGNASAWNDGTDEAYADEIIARLDSGDIWAWAQVSVRATIPEWEGLDGCSYLGGCCYANENDFTRPDLKTPEERQGLYYDDMKAEAIEALADEILIKAFPSPPKPDEQALAIVRAAVQEHTPSACEQYSGPTINETEQSQ